MTDAGFWRPLHQLLTEADAEAGADAGAGADTGAGAGGFEACVAGLGRLDVPAMLASVLAADLAGQLTAESYRHPNGFDKISFPPAGGCASRLRLHVWPATSDLGAGDPGTGGQPDIHNHRWPFVSRVLAGAVRNETFLATARADGRYLHYRHTVSSDARYRFELAGRADLALASAFTARTGETYVLRPDVVHAVRPGPDGSTGPTVTVVVELPPVRPTTDVYVAAGPKRTGALLDTPRFAADELRGRLEWLHALLTGAPPAPAC